MCSFTNQPRTANGIVCEVNAAYGVKMSHIINDPTAIQGPQMNTKDYYSYPRE